MNPEEEPGPIESVEAIGAGIAHALARYVNSVPFLNKGGFPLIFAPILLLGAYFQALGLWDAVKSDYAMLTWPRLPAVVVSAGEVSVPIRQYVGRSGGTQGASRSTILDLRYRYTFKGKTYDSSGFGMGSWTAFSSESGVSPADWAKDHPAGSLLRVYVNPAEPDMSAVNPGPTFSAAVCMLVALPFTLIGLSGVLSDEAQAKLSFEAIAVGWCALILAIYALSHSVTIGLIVVLAVFLLLLGVIHRWVAKYPLTTMEEDLEAPPHDIADFRG